MSLLSMLLGNSTTILTRCESKFSWSTAGTGTRYLLIGYQEGAITLQNFHTSASSRAELLSAIESLEPGSPAKLLGIETREVTSEIYDLDLNVAQQRLWADLHR